MKALLLLALLLAPSLARPSGPELVLDSRVVWRESFDGFGGFSGLAVRDAGATFTAISDRGSWATGRMARTEGRLTGIELAAFGPLRAISGEALSGFNADAEGLAIDSRGRAFVSFEGFHRVRRYDTIGGPATDMPEHRDFPNLQTNSALEALAIDADGVLYAIPERSGALDRPFPVYRLRDGQWDKSLRLPRRGPFLVVDADFGPDGYFYLLERDFRWLGGFATRIRRFRLGPEGFANEETLLETPLGELDNMEGMSVWRDPAGRTRVTLISDDNFFALQATIVVEYLLAGG